MTDYWFARYKPGPAGKAGRGLVPISWQGFAVIPAFVALMFIGGGLMFYFGIHNQAVIGIPAFIACAVAGFSLMIWSSIARTDPVRSIDDYRAERSRAAKEMKS